MPERPTKAELSDRLREAEAEVEYWRDYAGKVEKDLLRAYHRLSEYDRKRIAELEEELERRYQK